MDNYCKVELKNIIYSKKYRIAFIMSTICLLIGLLEYLFNCEELNHIGSLYLFAESYSSGFYSILIFLAPIISLMPSALSYLDDKDTCDFCELINSVGKRKYFHTRFLVNALSGGLVLASSVTFYYIILMLIKGINLNDIYLLVFNNSINELIINSQILYVLIEIIFSFAFGVTFANVTICLSTILKNKYLTIVITILFHMFSSVVLSNISGYLNSQIIYSSSIYVEIGYVPRIAYIIVLNTISLGIAYMSINDKFKINIKWGSLFKLFTYLCIVLLILLRMNDFILLYGKESSIYEFLIYFFNGLYNIPYFISFCFLVIIEDIIDNIRDKTNVKYNLLSDIKKLTYRLIKFMTIIILIALLISIFILNIDSYWSVTYKESENIIHIFNTYSPLSILLITIINSFFYLFSIGFICITLTRILKNSVLSVIITIFIVIFNIATYIGRIKFLHLLSLTNYCLSITKFGNSNLIEIIIMSFIYWFCIIILFIHLYLNYFKILE